MAVSHMKIILTIALALMVATPNTPVMSDEIAVQQKPLTLALDKKFYSELYRTPPVLRDELLENRLNTIVIGRGFIISIKKIQKFKKNYRIVMVDRDAEQQNIKITYHVYIDSSHSISMLKEKEYLEFSGQLFAYTPVNSRRDAYILDILFEKGAMVLE
jgi:hypothetical protein